MPRGNITALVKEIDTDHDKYGWLIKAEVTGGTNGVGEVIDVAPTRQAIEWAEKGKLDQKISVGSEIVLQRVGFPERGETVYTAQRVTGFVLDHADDVKKGRKVLRRVPFKINMFANGYALVVALPDTKTELGDPSELVARIQEDQKAGNQTLIVGRVNDTPFSAEAITGRYDREAGKFVEFDAESVAGEVMGRISDVTRNTIEKAEAAGEDITVEMNAYGLRSFPIGQSTRDMLNEQMDEKGRFSMIPIESMFPRNAVTHIRTALAALEDQSSRITNAAKNWVENNLDANGRQAYAQKGFSGLSDADLGNFLNSMDIKVPRIPGSQAHDWKAAREILSKGDRKRISTGWVVGDVVIQTLFDKKKKPVMEYPVRAMHYTSSRSSAAPFFPDEKFLKERNDSFFTSVREGFKAFIGGGAVKAVDRPDVAEAHADAPAADEMHDALSELLNGEALDTEAFPEVGGDVNEE